MEIYRVAIAQIRDESESVRSFFFSAPEGFSWKEGTHIHIALPGYDAEGVNRKEYVRHMSIMTLPEEGRMGFATRLDSSDSPFKKRLSEMKAGDDIFLFKPGSCLALRRDGRPVVVYSMGVAMTSVRSLVMCYARDREGIPSLRSATVNRRVRYPFQEELEAVRVPGLALRHLNGRAALAAEIDALDVTERPICLAIGSDEFMCDVIRKLRARGVPDEDIVLDLKEEKRRAFYEKYALDA